MKITLDLFGFTKTIDVSWQMAERGELNVPLSYSLEDLEVLARNTEIKASDVEHSHIRFFECEDRRWRPKRL